MASHMLKPKNSIFDIICFIYLTVTLLIMYINQSNSFNHLLIQHSQNYPSYTFYHAQKVNLPAVSLESDN